MKLLDTRQWQIHVICACARQIYFTGCTEILLDAQKILLDARLMQGKFTGCMAVASARIIRTHTLHGANSWSEGKKSMLLNQSDCRDS